MLVLASVLALILSLFYSQDAKFVPPGGVSGELRTIDGVPAIGVRVVAIPVPNGNAIQDDGLQYFELAPPTGVAMTDNDGHYIFRELDAGRYYIMAGVSGQATYYPDSDNLKNADIIN